MASRQWPRPRSLSPAGTDGSQARDGRTGKAGCAGKRERSGSGVSAIEPANSREDHAQVENVVQIEVAQQQREHRLLGRAGIRCAIFCVIQPPSSLRRATHSTPGTNTHFAAAFPTAHTLAHLRIAGRLPLPSQGSLPVGLAHCSATITSPHPRQLHDPILTRGDRRLDAELRPMEVQRRESCKRRAGEEIDG
jgi:hypothetical protein